MRNFTEVEKARQLRREATRAEAILELDGNVHEEEYQRGYDRERDAHLTEQGFRVLRFKNEDVERNLDYVLKRIQETISSPLPLTGEGSCHRGGKCG